jgi:hypothetical protein
MVGRVGCILVVIAVSADVDEIEDVAAQHRQQRHQIVERGAMRHLQLECRDGDGDDDGDEAEGFEPVFAREWLS